MRGPEGSSEQGVNGRVERRREGKDGGRGREGSRELMEGLRGGGRGWMGGEGERGAGR